MRRQPVVLSLLVIAIAAGGWWWKSRSSGPAAAGAPPASAASGASGVQTVGVLKAQRRDVPVQIEVSGTVSALKQVDLRPQTTSVVREVLIKDGDTVRQGQLLFRFDDRADRANLEKARAQAARDRASLADLERQYQRAQDLRTQSFVAQNAVDTALASLEAARALVQSDDAAVQSAAVMLSYNEVRAPLSGRAGAVNVYPGSLVQANTTATPLVSIAQIDPIGISANLPENQLAAVLEAAGNGGKAGLAVEALLPGGSAPLKGRIHFVDNQVDASTGTIKVKAEFANPDRQLWPGQYVRLRLQLRTLKDAVVVPQAALILRGSERVLYVVDADKNAQLRPVQLRYGFGELAVVEGVTAGETVVVDGKQNLRPGTPVREQAAAVNPARAASAGASSASGATP